MFSKQGYTTVERTFVPDNVGLERPMKRKRNKARVTTNQFQDGPLTAVDLNHHQHIDHWNVLLGVQSALKSVEESTTAEANARLRRSLQSWPHHRRTGAHSLWYDRQSLCKEDFEDQRRTEHVPHLCRGGDGSGKGEAAENPRRVVEQVSLSEVVMTHDWHL